MVFKSIIGAVCTCLAVVSFNANAALVSSDLNTLGDKLLTRDTETGLEWLDLNETFYTTFNEMGALFTTGEIYEGFRYATTDELITITSHAGISVGAGTVGERDEVIAFVSLTGGGWLNTSPTPDQVVHNGRTLDGGSVYFSIMNYWVDTFDTTTFSPFFGTDDPNRPDANGGTWIVREVSAVPIPSAVWLFASGLLGLIGVAIRKKA